MTESDKGHLSDSLHDFFKMSEEAVNGNGPTIEYHNGKIAIPTASSPETDDDSLFTKMNDNPNEGMVIVQIDDGGPRMKRTRPTEIVIPIEHVSSSDSIESTPSDSEYSSGSSESSSDAEDQLTEPNDEINSDGYTSTGKTNLYSSQTSPCKTCKLDLKHTSSCSTSPNNVESEFKDNGSDRRERIHSSPKTNGEDLDSDVDVEDSQSNYTEDTGELSDTDGDETDAEYSADETESATSSVSSSSNSGSNRSCSVGLPKESLLNICQKFKNGTAKLQEFMEARERLGTHFMRTRPHHTLSNFVALRMYSSLSANYNLRNIGYVDLTPHPARPNSATIESVINRFTPAVGDAAEIHHGNVRQIPVDETPTENNSSSPVCSTRFDFTPAARSKIEGAITACSDVANGAHSAESGRKNPQAKQDNEVRCNRIKEMQKVDLRHRPPKQVLPPIFKGECKREQNYNLTESRDVPMVTTTKPIVMPKSAVKQTKPDCYTRKLCSNMKPGVPRQLRSVACYQDGKVEVSITGDKRLIPESEPLNVNITFIHRQDTFPAKKMNGIDATDDKTETASQNKYFSLPKKNIGQSDEMPTAAKKALPPLKNPPRTFISKCGQAQNVGVASLKGNISSRNQTMQSRKTLPPLRNVPQKMKRDIRTAKSREPNNPCKRKQKKKFVKKFDHLNWDIVNERAQWPPFNTHINQEASERHQKMFADIPV